MLWAADLLQEWVAQIIDSRNSFLGCDDDVQKDLHVAAQNLLNEGTRHSALLQLDALIDTAHDRMAQSSSSICWRRLYTDACILRSLADIDASPELDEPSLLASIARLDHAIVIAGAPGESRLEFILDLINRIQCRPNCFTSKDPPPTTGRFSLSPSSDDSPLATSFHKISCLPNPPSLGSFQARFSQQPFILRGYISDWPALNEHPWSSLERLRAIAGPGRVVPVEVGSDYRTDDWTQRMMKWDSFLTSLAPSQPDADVLYLAQHNLFMQFPALREDIFIPDYVYSCPSSPQFADYIPPNNEDQLVVNVWLGPKGTISPAHTDPYFNIYAQVVGRKTVWLAHPDSTGSMYPYPPSRSTADHCTNPAANTINPSMSNTSRVDVFPPPETEEASRRDYPKFWEEVVPHAMSATLSEGDLLFFPPGWWHAMRSEDISFSVSMWF